MNQTDFANSLAFVRTSNDWTSVMRIANEAKRRLASLEAPRYTQTAVKAIFRPGMTVELVNLSKEALNGATATVVEVLQTRLMVDAGGYKTTIPAQCALPIPDSEAAVVAASSPKLPVIGDPVRVTAQGKWFGLTGVIVGMGKRYDLLLDNGSALKAGPTHFELLPRPAANPNLVVVLKNEYGTRTKPQGSVRLVDESVTKITDAQAVGTVPAGVTDFGWHDLKTARAIAASRGARLVLA